MRPDILDLERFYRSKLGESARRLINVELRALWPNVAGASVLGIGYAVPFLPQFAEAERTLALMPATQGVWPWPAGAASMTALGREDELPFGDGSFERIILAHAFECSPHINRLLRETWRLLKDGGKLIAIVPNRRGLWCWGDNSPFSIGQPFNAGQLEKLIHSHLFQVAERRGALFMPPWKIAAARRLAIPVERLGLRVLPQFSGVHVIEAEKQIIVPSSGLRLLRPSSRRYLPIRHAIKPMVASQIQDEERT